MRADPDDEALSWGDEYDTTHVDAPAAPSRARSRRRGSGAGDLGPDPDNTVSDGSWELGGDDDDDDDTDDELDDDDDEATASPGSGSLVLVTFGILSGVYLIYTIGWVISAGRFVYYATTPLEQVAFTTQQYLGVAAAPLWFAVTLWLTRDSRAVTRLVWLLIGAVALIPWSFALGS